MVGLYALLADTQLLLHECQLRLLKIIEEMQFINKKFEITKVSKSENFVCFLGNGVSKKLLLRFTDLQRAFALLHFLKLEHLLFKCKSELEIFHMLSTLVDGINVFKVTMKQLQILFNVDISHNSKKSIISKKKKKKGRVSH